MARTEKPRAREEDRDEFDERVVDINRVAKVIKGGRRFGFRTVMVVGDNRGSVGIGVGRAQNVPDALRKSADRARKNMRKIPMVGTTVPHEHVGIVSGARVLLKPASPGTGIIAGGPVRSVMEQVGVHNILTKRYGSKNAMNLVYATLNGLLNLKDAVTIANKRQITIKEVFN